MRKCILTAVLAVMLALPILAQPPGGFGFGFGFGRGMGDGSALLALPDVQKELKLTDDQKSLISEAQKARSEAMRKAMEDKDREAMKTATEDFNKAISKVKDKLTSAQAKRLLQIEIQMAAQMNQISIFNRKEVAEGLKLTEEQKATVKEIQEDIQKDMRELMQDAKGDRQKMFGMMQKMQTMNREAFAKITKKLTEEQKAAWKEMQGEPFKMSFGGFPGKGKGPRRPNKDDF
jgi:Spy/CpxP family protein refolding chaperone